jgi:glycosyltransferase involved in cell wall biosynthesis
VHNRFLASVGGGERHSGALARLLAELGHVVPDPRSYLERGRGGAEGPPVRIHANASRPLVEQLSASSSNFWHATRLGEKEDKQPWACEHFGITAAEAMAAGCVPLVIDTAGQGETVRHGIDAQLRRRLGSNAVERAKAFSEEAFSEEAFAARWAKIEPSLETA